MKDIKRIFYVNHTNVTFEFKITNEDTKLVCCNLQNLDVRNLWLRFLESCDRTDCYSLRNKPPVLSGIFYRRSIYGFDFVNELHTHSNS